MKCRKFALCLVAVALIFSVSVTSVPEYFLNNTVSVSAATYLKLNSSGTEVKNLQNDLILLGYMKSGSASGKFDTVTEKAVKKLQSDYGLTSDGIAGPDTLNLVEGLIDGTAKVVRITGSTVNVRSGAGTSYGKITTVKKGEKYTYSSYKKVKNVNWYKIKVGSKSGYVSGSYAKVVKLAPVKPATSATTGRTTSAGSDSTVTTVNTTTNNSSSNATSGKLTITGNNVNVRMGPGTSYPVVTKVNKDKTYQYTNVKSVNGVKWYYIKVNVLVRGWVSGSYVSVQSPTTAQTTATTVNSNPSNSTESTSTTTTAKTTTVTTASSNDNVRQVTVGTVTASKLNVRASASTSAAVLGTLSKGDDVVIVTKGTKWHKIEFGSGYGYVSADYINNIHTVNQAVSLKYRTDYYYVNKGSTIDVSLSVSGATITYSSSDSKSCPISAKGVVTGKVEGLYEITAKSGSASATTCVVVLREPYSNIKAMQISQKGTNFIADWEGGGTVIATGETVFYPYQDVSGFWTLGYGHAKTSTASKSWSEEKAIAEFNKDIESMIGAKYKMTDDKPYLSAEGASLLLKADLNDGTYVKAVSDWAVRNGVKLNQNQFDALVSFCYNLGPAYWNNDSNRFYLKSAIISHRSGSDADPDQIIEGFCRYIKSGGKNYKGLWYRRRNEAEMFIEGDYAIDRENKFKLPSDIVWA
ncbi:MAG: SH3 domain-containing protein [Firmicutes bacterium]|nr:SH3 domain-containing protein [Bacillota bacterium]